MSRQDMLIANLKDLRQKRDNSNEELKKVLDIAKNLKSSIKGADKEIQAIIDEL